MELDDPMVEMTSDYRMQMALELGDVLWYVTAAASDLGYELSDMYYKSQIVKSSY